MSQVRPIGGTLAEKYLRNSRDITIPLPATIGYLPPGDHYAWHPWSGERRPVMCCRVEHVEHGLVAVHRTWLAMDGLAKATLNPERATTGSIGGASVHLAEPRLGMPLVIAEGVESALSAMELIGWPVWAALSAIGIEKLILPSEVTDIVIAVDRDRDGYGERCARRASHRWLEEGRRVHLVIPDRPGTDPNDLLQEVRRA